MTYIRKDSQVELDGLEKSEAVQEKRIRWVAQMLNEIVEDEGVDALKGNGWVESLVYSAKKRGITNASEEMLIERFQNEGTIHVDKDVERLDKKARREGSLINQIYAMTQNFDSDLQGEMA